MERRCLVVLLLAVLAAPPGVAQAEEAAAAPAAEAASAPAAEAASAPAAEPASAPAAEPPAAPESPALARVREATQHLESLAVFRVDAITVFDAVQEDGRKLQFSDRRVVTVRRPDRARVTFVDDFGETYDVYYDGEKLTRYDRDENVYGQLEVPDTLDDMLDYLELELGAALPLADLFYSDLSPLGAAATESTVVGVSYAAGVYCDHLAFRNEDIDWQVWVEQGETPWIRKIVIDYKQAPSRPHFAAFFTSWDAKPEAGDALFSFVAPPAAEKVPTVALPARGKAQAIEMQGEGE
jgi:hypothetical protein